MKDIDGCMCPVMSRAQGPVYVWLRRPELKSTLVSVRKLEADGYRKTRPTDRSYRAKSRGNTIQFCSYGTSIIVEKYTDAPLATPSKKNLGTHL